MHAPGGGRGNNCIHPYMSRGTVAATNPAHNIRRKIDPAIARGTIAGSSRNDPLPGQPVSYRPPNRSQRARGIGHMYSIANTVLV